ncbi:transcriptional repressor LexA [Kordiimonas sp. SCSIO 12610]|uniref:transcriptional repressor LexA n=1 Tax=Kordiimonas sp. SCSIO 12610 TaxID=2829597 RepID=UPI00210DA01D|nr:transcriptional repressor LexA [Kordiimonas sp. SCSIO 12610]UTW54043.1 transcriptional repressor LexA [Kordiimonas sp. SCSIO 12610]
MLTSKQHQLLVFIQERLEENGISPSFDEMKDALGLKSKSGVHRLINALEERGFIKRMANRARALEVLKTPDNAKADKKPENVISGNFGPSSSATSSSNDEFMELPLHGKIAAGTPIEALENNDSFISVPSAMAASGKCYALEISGDSMIEMGILDGDTVVIESCNSARNGEVVVALVDREEATLKTIQHEGRFVNLVPANRDYSTQKLEADRVQVQGRLVGLLRQYH